MRLRGDGLRIIWNRLLRRPSGNPNRLDKERITVRFIKVYPTEKQPRLYDDLASWFHLLTAPEDYAEEAAFYRRTIFANSGLSPKTLLELGSGGGNNASHLKQHFEMTLVDVAPEMLKLSRSLNPECEHQQGDIRNIKLGRTFDAVFIHDAICYMTTEEDLRQAIETAFVHCKPGGVSLFCPDHTRENFRPSTQHGGHDGKECSLRYLEWNCDPDPTDSSYVSDMVYLLRGNDNMRCVHDRHLMGLFEREVWLRIINETGFTAKAVPFEHSEIEPGSCELFVGIKELP